MNDIPYIKVNEDFALIFKYYLPNVPNNGKGTVTITDSYAEHNALTTEKLLECALKNTPRILPVSLQSMQEALAELMGINPSELLEEKEVDIPMYILSNTEKYMGASALLYPDTRNLLLDRFDSDLILIPSSIHEWIVVPVTGNENIEDFSAMVQEVNHSSVSPTDVLGERAYFLSRENLSDTTQLLPIFEPAIVRQ